MPDMQNENIITLHREAMEAKQHVFRAQDALSLAWSDHAEKRPGAPKATLLRKLEKRLARVRRELEQLDNEVRWPGK